MRRKADRMAKVGCSGKRYKVASMVMRATVV